MSGLSGIPRATRRRRVASQPRSFAGDRSTQAKKLSDEVQEPLVEVFDEGDILMVIVDLPGVGEEDIRIEVCDDLFSIRTRTKGRKFAKQIRLPCPVDEGVVESLYKNGVSETRLCKVAEDEPEEKEQGDES